MFKKLLVPFLILGMVFFYECKDDHILPDQDQTALKKGKGGGSGGGGNGGGGGGGGNGGSGGLYGDLVICLRTADGIPDYLAITGEHGLAYYPQPIMIEVSTLFPQKDGDSYVVFPLNDEGEPIINNDDYMVKEVEFGRLNIVRAPQSVLDRALDEAIGNLNGADDIATDASGRLIAIFGAEDWLVNYDDDVTNDEFDDKTIDSPIENVAIYQELMGNGFEGKLSFLKSYFNGNYDMLSAGALAAGADKTGNMTVDELAYMNDWFLKWELIDNKLGPDEKGRRYYDFSGFSYDREDLYSDKIIRKTVFIGQTWKYEYVSLYDALNDPNSPIKWTDPDLLIDYANGTNTGISGFSNATDDAIQVLEYIHSSDLIVYSPYFVIPPTP